MSAHPEDKITNEMIIFLLNSHPNLVDYTETGTKKEWKFDIGRSRDRMYISTIALDLQADVWFFYRNSFYYVSRDELFNYINSFEL